MSVHSSKNILKRVSSMLLTIIFLAYCPCSFADDLPSIFDYSDIFADCVFVGEDSLISTNQKLSMQDNGQDYVNYWVQSSVAANYVVNGEVEKAREIIDILMGTFKRNGYFPRPVYDRFDYGWVSCMDAPTVAIAALMLYESTSEEAYLQFVSELSDYMTKDVSEKGFIANIGENHIWAFEYADENTTKETGKFVLNGSLLGVLEMGIVANVTGNGKLHQTAYSAYESIKQNMEEYWYKNDAWCYYMLNELRVNPPHYIIFEIRLLKAIANVFDDPFAENEAERRVALLKRYYKLYCYTDENNGDTRFVFVRAGAPHYYMTDIYGTELIFKDAEGNSLQTASGYGVEEENRIIQGVLPEGCSSVEWLVTDSDFTLDMGELTIEKLTSEELAAPDAIASDKRATADGILNLKQFLICSDSSEKVYADLVFAFAQPLPCENADIYAIEINNPSNQNLTAKIVLYGNDNVADRYVKSILPGKNLIVFSAIGCVNQGKVNLTSLNEIALRIYTSALTEDVTLEVGEFYCFDQQIQLEQYLENSEYQINFGQG